MATFENSNQTLKDKRTVTLRSLNSNDASAVREYLQKISHESTFTYQYPGKEYHSVEKYKALLEDINKHPFTLYLGAFENENLVSMGSLRREQEGHPWVPHVATFGMTVAKSHWGLGVATLILKGLVDHCIKHNVLRLEAKVRTNNPIAIALYKKEGFIIEGTRSRCALINGEYVDEYFIAKFFDEPKKQ